MKIPKAVISVAQILTVWILCVFHHARIFCWNKEKKDQVWDGHQFYWLWKKLVSEWRGLGAKQSRKTEAWPMKAKKPRFPLRTTSLGPGAGITEPCSKPAKAPFTWDSTQLLAGQSGKANFERNWLQPLISTANVCPAQPIPTVCFLQILPKSSQDLSNYIGRRRKACWLLSNL